MSMTRFKNGLTNVAKGNTLEEYIALDPTKAHEYFSDFDTFTAADWVLTAISVGAGTSAVTLPDTDGGVALITTAANENDGLWAQNTAETFLLETGKKTWIKSRFFVGDAIQSDIIIGLHSTSTTPQAATMRFLFESVDASAAMYFNVDDNTTDVDSATVVTLADDTFVTVGAYYDGVSTIRLYANDVHTATMRDVDIPGAEMAFGFGYINGAAGAETAGFDYLMVSKER